MYKVYLISSYHQNDVYYKIGWTKRDPAKRLKELRTGNSQKLELVKIFESKWGPRVESSLHKHFKDKRCEGEWFLLSEQDVSQFESICQKNNDIFDTLLKENSWFQQSKEFSKYH